MKYYNDPAFLAKLNSRVSFSCGAPRAPLAKPKGEAARCAFLRAAPAALEQVSDVVPAAVAAAAQAGAAPVGALPGAPPTPEAKDLLDAAKCACAGGGGGGRSTHLGRRPSNT